MQADEMDEIGAERDEIAAERDKAAERVQQQAGQHLNPKP